MQDLYTFFSNSDNLTILNEQSLAINFNQNEVSDHIQNFKPVTVFVSLKR